MFDDIAILHVQHKIFNAFIAHKSPLVVLGIALLALFTPAGLTLLEYNRTAISHGELWRLLTGHFYHTNFIHFLLNGTAVFLLWAIHGQFYQAKVYLGLFLFCSLFTSVALFMLSPLVYYVGLSGVLHGLFVWGALKDLEVKEKSGYLLLAGVVFKLTHEQFYGASDSVASLIEANVAIDSHLYGAIAGLLFYLLQRAAPNKMS